MKAPPKSWPVARMDSIIQPIRVVIIRAVGRCLRCHETKELTGHGSLCAGCMKLVTQ